jgi:hypothetical protein
MHAMNCVMIMHILYPRAASGNAGTTEDDTQAVPSDCTVRIVVFFLNQAKRETRTDHERRGGDWFADLS